jgi:hypothetical protein
MKNVKVTLQRHAHEASWAQWVTVGISLFMANCSDVGYRKKIDTRMGDRDHCGSVVVVADSGFLNLSSIPFFLLLTPPNQLLN